MSLRPKDGDLDDPLSRDALGRRVEEQLVDGVVGTEDLQCFGFGHLVNVVASRSDTHDLRGGGQNQRGGQALTVSSRTSRVVSQKGSCPPSSPGDISETVQVGRPAFAPFRNCSDLSLAESFGPSSTCSFSCGASLSTMKAARSLARSISSVPQEANRLVTRGTLSSVLGATLPASTASSWSKGSTRKRSLSLKPTKVGGTLPFAFWNCSKGRENDEFHGRRHFEVDLSSH